MKKFIPIALGLALCACGGTRVVDLNDQKEVAAMQDVMELEYRDWTKTAETMTQSMLKSGAFRAVKNPVIAMGPIVNDTQQRFDTDILTKKIRTTLMKSGTVQVATNFSGEDTTTEKITDIKKITELEKNCEKLMAEKRFKDAISVFETSS